LAIEALGTSNLATPRNEDARRRPQSAPTKKKQPDPPEPVPTEEVPLSTQQMDTVTHFLSLSLTDSSTSSKTRRLPVPSPRKKPKPPAARTPATQLSASADLSLLPRPPSTPRGFATVVGHQSLSESS